MLNKKAWQASAISENDDIEALRASYWAVMVASAHYVFSKKTSDSSNQSPETGYQLPADQTSQWLPEVAQRNRRKPIRQMPKPVIRPTEPASDSKLTQRAKSFANQTQTSKTIRSKHRLPLDNALYQPELRSTIKHPAVHEKIDRFFESFKKPQPPSSLNFEGHQIEADNPMLAPSHPVQENTLPLEESLLEIGGTLDMLNEKFAPESLPLLNAHWVSRALNRPRLVAGVIGLCLLASSVYAGLGYWWITATSLSHAAEPDNAIVSPEQGKFTPENGLNLLKNIEAIQNENNIIVPEEPLESEDRLIAQATPAKTFTMSELRNTITEPTGRPDPFAPLIQEGSAGFEPLNDPKQKKDILTDVQYTGFIGDVNSKDKVAVIKVADPAGGTKTLIKKTGESFYVEGERVYLKGITQDGLTLRVEGVNRKLGLNPYQEIVSAPSTTGGSGNSGSTSSSGGTTAQSGKPLPSSLTEGNTDPVNPGLMEPGR